MKKYRIRIRPDEGDYFIQEKSFLFWRLSEKAYSPDGHVTLINTYTSKSSAMEGILRLKEQEYKRLAFKEKDKKYKKEIFS